MPIRYRAIYLQSTALALLLGLSGCASDYKKSATDLVEIPEQWQIGAITEGRLRWSDLLDSPELNELLRNALLHNQNILQKKLDLEITRTELMQANMRYVPELDTRLTSSRNRLGESSAINNSFSLSADMRYELNIWGQVSDNKRAAAMRVAAAEAAYEEQQRQLVTQLSSAWAKVVESQKLVSMGARRLDTLKRNQQIIESGYRSGLNSALEVYLARNDVENESSKLEQAQLNLSDNRRQLNLMLGRYPSNQFDAALDFPQVAPVLPPELPSEILRRRPDLKSAWLQLLSSNSQVAMAHKARFPSLSLTASTGVSSSELGSLLENGNPTWNISANLLQPLLSSGRLKAAEQSAELKLKQQEYAFNLSVYNAFLEVDSALQQQNNLRKQEYFIRQSRDNALLAEKLSFEQYLKGIVSYTTVLDAQKRAVDAEVKLISLERQIFENKIQLLDSLAGDLDFISTTESNH